MYRPLVSLLKMIIVMNKGQAGLGIIMAVQPLLLDSNHHELRASPKNAIGKTTKSNGPQIAVLDSAFVVGAPNGATILERQTLLATLEA
jgi:hypothetical protein